MRKTDNSANVLCVECKFLCVFGALAYSWSMLRGFPPHYASVSPPCGGKTDPGEACGFWCRVFLSTATSHLTSTFRLLVSGLTWTVFCIFLFLLFGLKFLPFFIVLFLGLHAAGTSLLVSLFFPHPSLRRDFLAFALMFGGLGFYLLFGIVGVGRGATQRCQVCSVVRPGFCVQKGGTFNAGRAVEWTPVEGASESCPRVHQIREGLISLFLFLFFSASSSWRKFSSCLVFYSHAQRLPHLRGVGRSLYDCALLSLSSRSFRFPHGGWRCVCFAKVFFLPSLLPFLLHFFS